MANNPIREHYYHFIDENDQNSTLACQGHLGRVYNNAEKFLHEVIFYQMNPINCSSDEDNIQIWNLI